MNVDADIIKHDMKVRFVVVAFCILVWFVVDTYLYDGNKDVDLHLFYAGSVNEDYMGLGNFIADLVYDYPLLTVYIYDRDYGDGGSNMYNILMDKHNIQTVVLPIVFVCDSYFIGNDMVVQRRIRRKVKECLG